MLELVRVLDGRVDELEACLSDEPLPGGAGKHAERVPVVDDPFFLAGTARDDEVVDLVCRSSRRMRPLEVAQAATVVAVVAAVIGLRLEDLGRRVGREDDHATGPDV